MTASDSDEQPCWRCGQRMTDRFIGLCHLCESALDDYIGDDDGEAPDDE